MLLSAIMVGGTGNNICLVATSIDRWRAFLLRLFGAKIGKNVVFVRQ